VRRLLALVVVVGFALSVPPAMAQRDVMPKELWSAYPLVQEVERSSTPSLGPLLPTDESGTAPGSESAPNWAIWGAAMSACLVALLLVTGLIRPVSTGPRAGREPSASQRDPALVPRADESRILAQYASAPPHVRLDVQDEEWRSIVMRTGLLRGRYVVLEGEPHDTQRAIATSRSFWSLGGERIRGRLAEDAWDELLNDLRSSGWEPDPDWHSDFYVLLQPVEPEEPASIISTLEAYGGTVEDDSAEA
jgi:hypothetical protein